MFPAIVRLMVSGIKESALIHAPSKILMSDPTLGLALRHRDLQGEGVSTFPAQVTAGVLVGEIRDTAIAFPCSSIQLYNPITHM